MKFTKMHGCANDFIVVHEATTASQIDSLRARTPELCDRRRGIGGDGVILVLPSKTCDFQMRIFNADGTEPEMCGNGIRCFARYVRDNQLSQAETLTVETLAGPQITQFVRTDVRVTMNRPIFAARQIPVALPSDEHVLMHPLQIDGREFLITALSMGNPHAVIYADELTDDLVLGYGPKIEVHPFFPRKVNVEFISVLDQAEIKMRVWERGCGETFACGTGACASVVSGILNKKHGNDVVVHLLGGDLRIEWDGTETGHVYMTGPAISVFQGEIT